jgi:hypothetical protein
VDEKGAGVVVMMMITMMMMRERIPVTTLNTG